MRPRIILNVILTMLGIMPGGGVTAHFVAGLPPGIECDDFPRMTLLCWASARAIVDGSYASLAFLGAAIGVPLFTRSTVYRGGQRRRPYENGSRKVDHAKAQSQIRRNRQCAEQ